MKNFLLTLGFIVTAVGAFFGGMKYGQSKADEKYDEIVDNIRKEYASKAAEFNAAAKNESTPEEMVSQKVQKEEPKKTTKKSSKKKEVHMTISKDAYYEDGEYDKVTLFYYDDHVITDTDEEVIEDVDDILGDGFVFDENEEIVYIRNTQHKTDYEIIRKDEDYKDIIVRKYKGK